MVAVVFIIMGALTVIVIAVLVLRYRRGNDKSTGRKKKYIMTLCSIAIATSMICNGQHSVEVSTLLSPVFYRDTPTSTNKPLELSKLSVEATHM